MTMPNFLKASMRDYLDRLASGEPVPGGGSAAGLAGAMGAALLCMSAHFTIGRPRYADFEPVATRVLTEAETLRAELQQLIERDAEAYACYGAASALPKESEEEKTARHAALQQATKDSAMAPMETARACVNTLALAEQLAIHCNPNLVSDVAVAAELALSGFQSAALNVRINLRYLDDHDFVAALADELRHLTARATTLTQSALGKAHQVMHIP
jgi:formiminotetrahydrofolate cyclodeaminase